MENLQKVYLQKLPRYLSGIVTSTFKVGTPGCAGRLASPGFPGFGFGGLSGVFPTIFVLYLMIYHLKRHH